MLCKYQTDAYYTYSKKLGKILRLFVNNIPGCILAGVLRALSAVEEGLQELPL